MPAENTKKTFPVDKGKRDTETQIDTRNEAKNRAYYRYVHFSYRIPECLYCTTVPFERAEYKVIPFVDF